MEMDAGSRMSRTYSLLQILADISKTSGAEQHSQGSSSALASPFHQTFYREGLNLSHGPYTFQKNIVLTCIADQQRR